MAQASKSSRPATVPARGHGGRPTAAEAKRRRDHLLETAGERFLQLGFDGTSMEAVAESAGISKQTLYAHYPDKSALFSAVLQQLIDRWLLPISRFEARRGQLEPTLLEIGRHLLASVLEPSAVQVHRILVAEAGRQSGFGRFAYREGGEPAIRSIATVLRRHREQLAIADFETAAEQFLSLVIDHSLRLATLGVETDPAEIERRAQAAVALFLHGALKR